ncbi:MAG: hypothetical protein IJY23_09250 [Clostridia bacterium]|nr:hypothetical protein [Clostridia bacterium]
MAKYCCVCKRMLERDDAPILTMSAYGSPKCLCDECADTVERATASRDYEEIINSCQSLGDALTRGDTGDIQVINTVNSIISEAKDRAEKINDGTYDFSIDEKEDEEEFEITEDLEETEEDRAKDEKEAKVMKLFDTITSWAAGIILLGAVIFFIIKFVI